MTRAAPLAMIVMAAVAWRAASGQTVRGTVVQPDSVSPVGGVLVVGVDANGVQAARSLSSPRGEFTLRFPRAGAYRLELLRIGFRPMTGPALAIAAGESRDVRIVYDAGPIALAAMNVRDRQTCRVNADTGLGVARVWDEARKAMLIARTSSDGAPLVAEWVEYDRLLDSTARIVRSQRVRSTRAATTHAFRAVSLALLDTAGFVVSANDVTTFYAPDVDVLLSDVFIGGHCFRLDDARRREGLLGLAFEPTPERSDKHEIRGTMWLDERSAELRTIDFTYTNLVDVAMGLAGGSVEFLRLGDGSWLVRRWNVRMPQVESRPLRSADGTRRTIMARSNLHVAAVQVMGGEVTAIQRGDSVLFRAAGPRVAVQLVSRDSEMAAAGASVRLDGTDYVGVADSAGLATIAPVLAGRYGVRVITPIMAAVDMPPAAFEVEASAPPRVDTLVVPAARDIVASVCPRDSVRNGEGLLHGDVHDASGRPVAGAAIAVRWQDNFQMMSMSDANRLQYDTRVIGSLSDDAGRWRACGVPRDRVLQVEVQTDSGSDRQRQRLVGAQSVAAVHLVLHPVMGRAAQDVESALGRAPRSGALVEFTVVGPQGQVLPATTLDLADAVGARRTLTTGPGGRALAASLAPGRLSIITRHVGYAPGKLTVDVAEGRNTVPIILNEQLAPTLDTVRVVGGRTQFGLARNDEFDQRRLMKLATVSYTRDDIRKRNPVDLWQLLSGVPSIQLVGADKYGGVIAQSARSTEMTPDMQVKPCYFVVMVDAIVKNPEGDPFDLRLLPPPADVYGVEVFAGPSSIPLQYNGSGREKWCGMIAVWTR